MWVCSDLNYYTCLPKGHLKSCQGSAEKWEGENRGRLSQLCRKANLRLWRFGILFSLSLSQIQTHVCDSSLSPLLTGVSLRCAATVARGASLKAPVFTCFFFKFYFPFTYRRWNFCASNATRLILAVIERIWSVWPCFSLNHMPRLPPNTPLVYVTLWKHIHSTSIILYISFWKTNSHNRILSMWFE